jgi:hypothetical protein
LADFFFDANAAGGASMFDCASVEGREETLSNEPGDRRTDEESTKKVGTMIVPAGKLVSV